MPALNFTCLYTDRSPAFWTATLKELKEDYKKNSRRMTPEEMTDSIMSFREVVYDAKYWETFYLEDFEAFHQNTPFTFDNKQERSDFFKVIKEIQTLLRKSRSKIWNESPNVPVPENIRICLQKIKGGHH